MKNPFTLLRIWCVLTILSLHSLTTSNLFGQCDPVIDSLALVALYDATNGDNWLDNTNWLEEGQPISIWDGVTTTSEGCVLRLQLSNNNMVGELPLEIGSFTVLEELIIYDDQLIGELPQQIGGLILLKQLSLKLNGLSGNIPPEIGNLENLEQLGITGEQLTGSIPPEVGNLENLKGLGIKGDQLTGNIPPEIGNLENLENLGIFGDQITGSIPAEIGNLANLKYLSLSGNQLTGTIPPEIGDLSSLVSLMFVDISITGGIPPQIGDLANLVTIDLINTQLNGSIPAEIGNLQNLEYINLDSNPLQGNIPSEIGNLEKLTFLTIKNSQLSGNIPPEIGNLPMLYSLIIKNSQLSGNIPPEIGNLPMLIQLEITNSELSGTIPPELFDSPGLEWINFQNNDLSGSIPSEIGNLSGLSLLNLNQNHLVGPIPIELGELVNLKEVYIRNNQLSGPVPPEIGNLLDLQFLELTNNHLTGNIPKELGKLTELIILELGQNNLTGELPIELTNLTNVQIIGLYQNQLYGCIPPQYSVFCGTAFIINNNPGLLLPNNDDWDSFYDYFCTDGTGSCPPSIKGIINFDLNQNCEIDSSEYGLKDWLIKATGETADLFSISNAQGEYEVLTHPESYEIELIQAPGPYWEESCTGVQNVIIEDSLSLDTINFFPSALALCPYLTVDISTPRLRRCFENTFNVDYCNYGTISAEEAFVKIYFDPLLTVNSTSIPITEQEGSTYTFNIGEVEVGECGSFSIHTTVSCDSELGQTLCTTAKIYPDSLCAGIPPEWSGANIEVEGVCEGDEVLFTIANTGEGDMQSEQTYTIIQDGVIITPEPIPFFLSSGESIEASYEADGSTHVCQTTPVPFDPFESIPSAFVEACGTNELGGFSTGYATQFPENDTSPFVSIDCQHVIGSFDPNDKQGFPEGYGESHYIERDQDIEYLIRFQNTGTDTAFTVVVEDVLSPHLDITSLRLGASSHPYILDIVGSDTLKFIFESILLVDSVANEPASHGFIKFKISQKSDLPLETVIENQAAIFFDFNDPVLTNTTFHTIGENFIEVEVNQLPYISGLEISVAPNPVTTEAVVRVTGIDFQKAEFRLFNTLGVEVKREVFSDDIYIIHKSDLPEGLYVFEILVDGVIGGVGKLVVE